MHSAKPKAGLVEHAFAEIVLWQLAIIDKVWLRTSAGRFSVPAFEVPPRSKARAQRALSEGILNIYPLNLTVGELVAYRRTI